MCVRAHSSNRSAKVLKLTKLELTCPAPDMCVLRNTHMCMPTAAIGRPARGPGVQPSIDFFCSTHCVCVHSSSWSAKGMFIPFSWLHPWMILQHTCVCSQQQLVGQPSVDIFCHTCVFAHSSNRSAKVLKLSKLQLTCSARDMCVYPEAHKCMPTAIVIVVGWPTLTLGCHHQLTSSTTHMCVWSQQQLTCQSC